MRHNPRRDANAAQIILALQKCGCAVLDLEKLGGGCPDIIVFYRDRARFLEIKTAKGALSWRQKNWRNAWTGPPPITVRTIDEALAAVGITQDVRVKNIVKADG